MGAWGDWSSPESIAESPAGSGAGTSLKSMNPGEKHQIGVERTDAAGAGDDWRVSIQLPINDTPDYADDPPARSWRLKSTQTTFGFLIAGPKEYRIWVENADGSPIDIVAADVCKAEDGVSI